MATTRAIKGKFDVTTLPIGKEGDSIGRDARRLEPRRSEVSRRTRKRAIELVKFLASPEKQKVRRTDRGQPADDQVALRRCRHRREAADHSALEGRSS